MNLIRSLVYHYRRWRYREKPLPRIDVKAGWTVPAWVIRVVAAVCISICSGLATSRTALPWQVAWPIIAALGAWTLIRPGYEVAVTGICLAGGFLLIAHGGFDVAAPWIILAGYLALRLIMAAALVSWRATVAVAAVITWRDGVITAVTSALGALALLPGGGTWGVIIGLVAVVALALALLTQASHRDADELEQT